MNSEMQAREVLAGGMDAEFPVTASRLRSIDFETDLFPKGTQVSIRVLTQLLEQRAELLEALRKLEKAGENMRNTVVESRGLRYMDAHDLALREARDLIAAIALAQGDAA